MKIKNSSVGLWLYFTELSQTFFLLFLCATASYVLRKHTLQTPSMQTSCTFGSLLHRVPSLTLPRTVATKSRWHTRVQGSGKGKEIALSR